MSFDILFDFNNTIFLYPILFNYRIPSLGIKGVSHVCLVKYHLILLPFYE